MEHYIKINKLPRNEVGYTSNKEVGKSVETYINGAHIVSLSRNEEGNTTIHLTSSSSIETHTDLDLILKSLQREKSETKDFIDFHPHGYTTKVIVRVSTIIEMILEPDHLTIRLTHAPFNYSIKENPADFLKRLIDTGLVNIASI